MLTCETCHASLEPTEVLSWNLGQMKTGFRPSSCPRCYGSLAVKDILTTLSSMILTSPGWLDNNQISQLLCTLMTAHIEKAALAISQSPSIIQWCAGLLMNGTSAAQNNAMSVLNSLLRQYRARVMSALPEMRPCVTLLATCPATERNAKDLLRYLNLYFSHAPSEAQLDAIALPKCRALITERVIGNDGSHGQVFLDQV